MKKAKDYSEQLFKGAALVMIGLFISKAIGYLYTIIIARIGTEVFGLYNLALSIISFLSIIALFGLKSGVVRYVSYYKIKNDTSRIKGVIVSALKISIPLSIIIALILFIFANFISNNIFNNPNLGFILRIFSITIPLLVITEILLSVAVAYKKIEYRVITNDIIEKLLKLSLAFVLIYFGFKLEAAIFSYVFSIIVSFILSIYFIKKIFPIFDKKINSLTMDKELAFYSFPLLFSTVLISVVKWIDTIMLGIYRTISEVGVYNVALSTSNLMIIVPTAVMSLFLPLITEKYSEKNFKQLKEIYNKTVRWIFTFNIIFLSVMILFSGEILNVMFGNEYVLGYKSLLILVLGYFIFSLAHIHSNYLVVIKKTKLVLLINVVMGLLNILLNLYLIPKYGMIGGAIATSTSLIVIFILSFLFTYKFNRINPYNTHFLKPVFAAVISTFIMFYIKEIFYNGKFISLFLLIIFFFFIYGLILYFIKGFDKEDKSLFLLIIKKLKAKSS